MSLINDAIKRAQDAPGKNPPPPPLPPLPPAEPESEGPNWFLIGLIVLLVINAAVFIHLAFSHKPKSQDDQLPVSDEPPAAVSAPAAPTPAPTPAPPPTVVAAAPAPEPQEIPATNPAVVETNIAAAAVPAAPSQLKVQGIIFAQPRPWAIVSGKTVFVGDRVRDCRVTAISKTTVTLQDSEGSVIKLNVGE